MSIVPQEAEKSVSKKQAEAEPKLSSEMTMEHRIKQVGQEYCNAHMNNEETILGLFDQIRSMLDDMEVQHDNGQFFVEALRRLSLGEPIKEEKEEKERLFEQYEQTRQKEKSIISEFAYKIDQLEESLKKKEKDDREYKSLVYTIMDYLL